MLHSPFINEPVKFWAASVVGVEGPNFVDAKFINRLLSYVLHNILNFFFDAVDGGG